MEITMGKILSYLAGISLILLSVLFLLLSLWAILPLLGGVLILPPVRRRLADRFGVTFSRGAAAGIGVMSVIAILGVGLLGGTGGGTPPGADVSNVSVTAVDDAPPDAGASLDVVWNSRAQSAVDPDPDDFSIYNANDGQKFLVVRMTVTNTGSQQLELTPRLFRFEADGVEYDYQGLFGSGRSMGGVTLNPESSYTGWTVFSIPEDTTEGRLIVHQDAYFQVTVAVSFAHDREMAINMSD